MDSQPISEFLEKTYPELSLPLTSERGRDIEHISRTRLGKTQQISIAPREINILCPRTQEWFRTKIEASFGQTLESIYEGDKEEQVWEETKADRLKVDELIRANGGPFVLGKEPSYTDFFLAGNMQSSRMVEESVFDRMYALPGFKAVYDACAPWMERRD